MRSKPTRKVRVPIDFDPVDVDDFEAARSTLPIPPTRNEFLRRLVRAGLRDFAAAPAALALYSAPAVRA